MALLTRTRILTSITGCGRGLAPHSDHFTMGFHAAQKLTLISRSLHHQLLPLKSMSSCVRYCHVLPRTFRSIPPNVRLLCSRFNTFKSMKNVTNSVFYCGVPRRMFSKAISLATNNAGKISEKTAKKLPKSSEIKRLLQLAKAEKKRLAAAIVFLLISSAVTMAVPFGIGHVIDIIYSQAEDGKMIERLQRFCLILLGVFVFGAAANFGRVYLMQSSGNKITKNLRDLIFKSIIQQEMAFFDKVKTGELISRLSMDTTIVGSTVTMNISDGLRSVAQATGGIAMMAYMSPKLTLVAMSIVPPMFLLSRTYGRYVKKITKDVQASLAESTQVAEEKLSNIRTVRAFGQEANEMANYSERTNHVLALSKKEALAKGIFWASTGLSGNFMILSLFYTGGLMMSESLITVGELSSFLLYAAFVGVSFGGLSTFYSELMRGIGASARLWTLVDRPPTIPLTDGIIPNMLLEGGIEFKDITFSYPSRESLAILSDFNLQIEKGKVLAVVGASGSGKSTIGSLILRYYDPEQGQILLDGTHIQDLSPQWIRQQIGVVSQEPVLFSCSIADNIAYGAVEADVTRDDILQATKMANAYDFIHSFPSGLDTLVGERGIMLSGGQKQRIAIARAILKNPKILLLDEATSALDAESEYLVQEALDRIMVGRTVITIAHRLSTIKNADKIAVLAEGRVTEHGSYGELMKIENGLFRKLVERQTIRN